MFPCLLGEMRKVFLQVKGRAGYIFEVFPLAEEQVFVSAWLIPIGCRLQYLLEIHLYIGVLVLSGLGLIIYFRLCLWYLPC